MKKALINYMKSEKNDMFYTPIEAVTPLIKNMPIFTSNAPTIWECCDSGNSEISKELKRSGFNIISTDIITGFNFLKDCPDFKFDMIITNPPFCYDGITDVLTQTGWRNIKEIKITDRIMSMNTDTKEIEYVGIKDIDKTLYKGDMYNFESKYVDLMVTPNHRMVSYGSDGKLRKNKKTNDLLFAKDIKGENNFIPLKGFKWNGIEKEFFILEDYEIEIKTRGDKSYTKGFAEKKIKMDSWLRFFGLWLADGHCRGTKGGEIRYDVGIKQHSKTSETVRDILNDIGYDYSEYENKNDTINFNIFCPQLHKYLFKFGSSREKFIPEIIKNLSSRQIKIFLDAYMFGDSGISRNGRKLSTVSSRLADDLSECFLKIGQILSFNEVKYSLHEKDDSNIYIAQYNLPDKIVNAKIKPKTTRIINNFDDYVYGLSLEKNFTMLVRRNGKICFSGNSLKDEFLTKCYEYGLPFALLLPITSLEGIYRNSIFEKFGISTIVLNKRINFIKGKSCYFNSSWFVWNFFDIKKNTLIFEKV